MTDRELLELAAKAHWPEESEVSFRFDEAEDAIVFNDADNQDHNGHDVGLVWDPRESAHDALNLAVDLDLNIVFGYCTDDAPIVTVSRYDVSVTLPNFPDPHKATRMAIVRAAAEIGKAMSHA